MSEGLNRCMLLGGLTADPELRFGQGGGAVLKIRLAITESYLDKDKVRRERTEYQNVVVFGRRGEALGKILSKGSQIFVEGSLRTSSYDNKEGVKVHRTEVVANNVILAGGKRGQSNAEEPGERGQSSGGGYGSGAASAPPVDDPGFADDGDMPFSYIGADPKDERQLPRKWL